MLLQNYLNTCHVPLKRHLNLAKHVLKYIKYTLDYELKFSCSNTPLKLTGYCDSDWGGCQEDRKSISGFCFQLCFNGPLISWRSKKQSVVALSSCEAEYISLTHAMQEAKFLRQLFADMKCHSKENVILFADNQGAIALANNPVQHQRSKHIDIKYHFIRDEIFSGTVDLKYIATEENVPDIFTKPAPKSKLIKFSCIRGVP